MSDGSAHEVRRRAEAIARQQGEPGDTPEDRLIYELKVHQIELEMQNQELQSSQQEIERARRQYELLFEFAPVPYFVFNPEGGVVEANHAGAALLRTDRRYLDRKPFVVFLPNEYHTVFFNHLRRVFELGHRQAVEVQITTRDGGQLWVRLESRQQRSARGETQCLTAALDISDRKRMEDDLILAREDAVSANRAKSAFLANMSHEIRTPMSGILSMAEVLLETELSQEQIEYLTAIHSASASLVAILDDLLDVSRVEADRLTITREPFAVAELMQTIESLFRPLAAQKKIGLTLDIGDGLSQVLVGDRQRIRQVLVNVLSTAVNSADAGCITLSVREETVADFLHELTFEVLQSGPGKSSAERRQLAEAFARSGDDDARFDGVGVGLSISRRLAKLMGGQLYFDSDADRGTRYFFAVPLELPVADDGPAPDNDAPPAEGDADSGRILVAEDNAINLLVIRTLLEKAGFEVQAVSNGFDVIQRLEASRFDLVLMDISMPGMDGLAATRAIRAHAPSETFDPQIPVIAISAHSMKGDRERFMEAGMNAYIAKPFVRDAVLSLINDQIGARSHE